MNKGKRINIYRNYLKRIFDLIVALMGLPFFILVYLPVFILIKIEDGDSVFYSAERIGRNKMSFKMYKFRSMKINAPDIRLNDGSTYNGKDDPRVTRIGKFLRESSIDEVPQLLNVLKGDMSIIGPRPDVPSKEIYPEEFDRISELKPGITGYNQAYFRNESSRLGKMTNDLYYSDHVSFLFDVKIFFKTFLVVFDRNKTYRNNIGDH